MNDLKRLIREVHRRSLWQVVTIYLAMSWGALQVVQTIVESAALPEWLPGLALVLLVIGFPIVVATAFVQEGAPGMGVGWSAPAPEPEESDAPAANAAGTGSLDYPRARPKAGRGFLTWKNATMGGVGAFALWGVVAAFLISTGRPVGPAPLAASDRAAVAVLPLESLAVEGGMDEAFARGFHDEIITRLSKISALRVTSRTSVMQYAGQSGNMRDIARDLGVDMLLEGSLQRAGDQIALNIQLIDGRTDEHLWAQSYNREYSLENVFAIQRQLAEEIAAELSMTLSPEEAAELAEMPTSNPDAWQTYLQANEFYWSGPRTGDFDTAIQLYERAVEQDPSFALAHARLAFSIGQWWQVRVPERTDAIEQRARNAVARALELDPTLPEAFLAEGQLYYAIDQNWGLALASASRAAATGLKGDYYHLMGAAQRRVGDLEGGVESWREMVAVDPLSGHYHEDLGSSLGMLGEYDEAERSLRRAIELAPDGLGAYSFIIDILLFNDGSTERAWPAVEALEAASGERQRDWREWLHYLDRDYEAALSEAEGGDLERSLYLRALGRDAEARALARQFEEQWQGASEGEVPGYGPGYWFWGAGIAAALGDRDTVVERVDEGLSARARTPDAVQDAGEKLDAALALTAVGEFDRAFDLLGRLYEQGNRELSGRFLAMHPGLDPLRDDPRFQAVTGG